ncbi:MAG: hypothetical protein Q9157_005969 [Trypethelium eluteriae]
MAAVVAAPTPSLLIPPTSEKIPLDAPPPYSPATPSVKKEVSVFESQAWAKALQQFREDSNHRQERIDRFLQRYESERSVQKICQERKQKFSEQYGKVLSKILDKIDIFVRAGNLAVKAAPESIGLAWTGISIVLSAIQDGYQTLQVFGSGCTDIVGIMISCRLFTRMFSTPSGPEELREIQEKVIEEVTKLYVKILEFSYQAWKYVAENKTNMKRTLDDIKTTLEKSAALTEELEKRLADLRKQLEEQKKRSPMDVAKETFGRQRKQLDCKFDDETLQRLQKGRLEARSKGTCQWVFGTKPYNDWFDSPRSDLLLLYGGGNMGKSVLVSSVIESLVKYSEKQDDVLTIFFFCKTGDDYGQLTDRIFRQALHALYINAEKSNLETLDKCNEAVRRYIAGFESGDNKGTEKNKDEDKATTFDEAFRAVASTLKKRIFLVIDALDECKDRERRGFISTIRKLTRTDLQVNENAENDGNPQTTDSVQLKDDISIKVFMSGRPEDDIISGFQSVRFGKVSPKINIETQNQEDIRNVVQSKLNNIPDLSTAERKEACEEITRKANSSFGYVRPALETFQKPWQRPIKDHLKTLPNDLLDMNARIFARIDPSYVGFLKTCLTWAMLANGKQMVKVEEVVDAYSRVYVHGDPEWKRSGALDDQVEFYKSQIHVAGSTLLEVKDTREISLIKPAIVKDSFLKETVKQQQEAVQQIPCEVCRSKAEASKGFTLTERDGHFQDQVQHLNSPIFQNLYIFNDSDDDESSTDQSEISVREDGNPTNESENSATQDEKFIDDDQNRGKSKEGTAEQEEEGTSPENLDGNSIDANGTTDLTEGSVGDTGELDATTRSEDPGAQILDETEDVAPTQDDEASVDGKAPINHELVSGDISDHDFVDQKPSNEVEVGGQPDEDLDSDADSDFQERDYVAVRDAAEDAEKTVRYEISQCIYHLQKVEKLWRDHDKPDAWEELWNNAISFFESKAFRKCIMEELIPQDWYFIVEPEDLTPLQFVAGMGLEELTRRLLEKGADPLTRTTRGEHALHFAACLNPGNNQIEICRMLLDKDANPNNDADAVSSPFLWMMFAFPNVEATTLFLEYKADATDKDVWAYNSLHNFAFRGTDPAMVQLLVDNGADINGEDENGETPLHKLVRRDDCGIELLEAYLKAEASVNKDDADSQQPLYEVSGTGNVEVAEVLLRHEADVHDKDNSGWTALHNAAANGHAKVVTLLIDHKADTTLGDDNLRTPFYLACANGDIDTVRSMADRLISRDPSVIDKPCKKGKTPLRKACGSGNLGATRLLLEVQDDHHIPLDINAQDSLLGRSALHAAAYLGYEDIVELLLSYRASTDLQDKQGKTPLQLAYIRWAEKAENDATNQNYQEVILQLIETNRHAAVADTELLRLAAIKGCMPILKALLHRKPGEPRADPNACDEHGWTAIDHAKQYGRREAELLLLARDGVFGMRPSRWTSTNEKKIMVSEDGLEIWQAPGAANLFENNQHHPIPSGIDRYYYEISLETQEAATPDQRPPTERFRRDWIPGVYKHNGLNSWGYHGDDGSCCQSFSTNDEPRNIHINEGYDPGDTVGCAIDFTKGHLFFTKMGRRLKERTFTGVNGQLYCAIGLSDPIKARVNFIGPFMWGPANDKDWKGADDDPNPTIAVQEIGS